MALGPCFFWQWRWPLKSIKFWHCPQNPRCNSVFAARAAECPPYDPPSLTQLLNRSVPSGRPGLAQSPSSWWVGRWVFDRCWHEDHGRLQGFAEDHLGHCSMQGPRTQSPTDAMHMTLKAWGMNALCRTRLCFASRVSESRASPRLAGSCIRRLLASKAWQNTAAGQPQSRKHECNDA
jgi:hypothetical protein